MIYLTKRDPEHNTARFYVLDVQLNLFGEWTLINRLPAAPASVSRLCVSRK